jgi:predicted transcriptional regulator of viral defense system
MPQPQPRQIPAACGPESATEGLRELAERQHGVISRGQLEKCNVAGSAITRWMKAGHLHRVHPHVYALGHRALSIEGRLHAALLYAGRGAALSHTTAAWVWSLIETEPQQIHLVTRDRRLPLPDVRVHRRRRIDAVQRRGFPLTSVAATLLDLAATLSFRQLRRALAEADYRGVLDVRETAAALGRGRRGSRALRQALDIHLPQFAETLSALEDRFLELCETAGLPLPDVNARVGSMRVDALWRHERVAVELDGSAAHSGWAAISRDRRRELALRQVGYRVVRYTWEQVTARPADVVGDLRHLLTSTAGLPRLT